MEENKELSMTWWNICKYALFPLGILLSILAPFSYYGQIRMYEYWGYIISYPIVITVILIQTVLAALFIYWYKNFIIECKPDAFKYYAIHNIVGGILSVVSYCISQYNNIQFGYDYTVVIIGIVIFIAILLLWYVPNYIYYKKRRDLFYGIEQNERKKDNEKQEDSELRKLIDNIKKEETITKSEPKKNTRNNKKYCTKCGKEIDNTWAFCNYCGNKLKLR